MIDPTSALLNRDSNTRSLEFILRALKEYSRFLKRAENSRLLTAIDPFNLEDDNQYTEQLIHDITFVLNNRRHEEPPFNRTRHTNTTPKKSK
jgi:hypothetical protein